MKNSKFTLFITGVLFLFVISLGACSKDDTTEPTTTPNNTPLPTPKPVWKDTISRKWKITKATHKGQHDASSTGKLVWIKKDGLYDWDEANFIGTWEFADSTYKTVVLDKATSSLKTTWTISTFTSKKLIVDFKSPFTGGAARWEMDVQ